MNAHPYRIAPFALAGLLALCGCHEGDHNHDHANSSEMAMAAPREAEMLAMLVAVDEHEIDVAEDARDKSEDGSVKAYAAMLDEDHKAHLDETKRIAKAAGLKADDTPKVDALQEKLKRDRDRLDDLKGAAYDRAYIDAMVKGHQEVLDLIDKDLDSAAWTPAVRNHLTNTRKHIAHHLEEAKRIRDGMKSST
jgi:putative membrane protein